MNIKEAVLLSAALLLVRVAPAAESPTFESCIDAGGRTMAAEPDRRQAVLVRTVREDGHAVLRYNPGVLPRLTFATRVFFYAHHCVRLGESATLAQARRADCAGLSALIGAGLMSRDDAATLARELVFSDAEWELLPGPRRDFDFSACRAGDALRLPPSTVPSATQLDWNACVRACADRLWTCQQRCRGEACDVCAETHRHCRTGCGDSPGGQ